MRWLFIFLLLATTVTAQTIADYPYFFFYDRDFNGYIIKGDLREPQEVVASNLVVNVLPQLYRPIFRIYSGYNFYRIRADPTTINQNVRLASQISFLDRPAIIVGTPCNNEWVRKVMNIDNCNVLPADEGFVLLTNFEGYLVIIITGGSPEMVLSAARWLHSEEHFRYFVNMARITKRTGFSAIQIGNGDLLAIGQPIGQVTPVVTVGYPGSVGTYLRFPGGRVVFGKGR